MLIFPLILTKQETILSTSAIEKYFSKDNKHITEWLKNSKNMFQESYEEWFGEKYPNTFIIISDMLIVNYILIMASNCSFAISQFQLWVIFSSGNTSL